MGALVRLNDIDGGYIYLDPEAIMFIRAGMPGNSVVGLSGFGSTLYGQSFFVRGEPQGIAIALGLEQPEAAPVSVDEIMERR